MSWVCFFVGSAFSLMVSLPSPAFTTFPSWALSSAAEPGWPTNRTSAIPASSGAIIRYTIGALLSSRLRNRRERNRPPRRLHGRAGPECRAAGSPTGWLGVRDRRFLPLVVVSLVLVALVHPPFFRPCSSWPVPFSP